MGYPKRLGRMGSAAVLLIRFLQGAIALQLINGGLQPPDDFIPVVWFAGFGYRPTCEHSDYPTFVVEYSNGLPSGR